MCDTSHTHISLHLFPSKPFSWIQFVVEAKDTGTEWHSRDRINTAKQMFNKSPSSFQFCCSNQEFTTSIQIYAWHNPSCAQKQLFNCTCYSTASLRTKGQMLYLLAASFACLASFVQEHSLILSGTVQGGLSLSHLCSSSPQNC